MRDAPRQDWKKYEAAIQAEENRWVKNLSAAERSAIYCDMFDVVWEQRQKEPFSEAYEEWRWNEKLKLRRQLLDAFTRLDDIDVELPHQKALPENAAGSLQRVV